MPLENDITPSIRSFILLSEALEYCGFTPPGEDALRRRINRYVDIVSGEIEDATNRLILLRDKEFFLDGNGKNYLPVPTFPVNSIYTKEAANDPTPSAAITAKDSLQYRSSDGTGDWQNIVPADAYIFIDPNQAWRVNLLGGYSFPEGKYNIRARLNVGWPMAEIPGKLTKVALEMLAMMHKESGKGEGLLGKISKSKGMGGGNVSTSLVDMNPKWRQVTESFRIRGV